MATLKSMLAPAGAPVTRTRVKLVRDAIGGIRMTTADGAVLENVFVKEYTRVAGSISRVSLEIIYIPPDDAGQNW